MITITLEPIEYFDDKNNEFIIDDGGTVRFEYSLRALYDWENKWLKPFLKGEVTDEELMDFYMTMALDPIEQKFINVDVMETLSEYILNSQTATTFRTPQGSQNNNKRFSKGKIYTAEEIYALMFEANVPLEFENRNLNRLLTILRIMSSHNETPKKMDKADIYKQNAQLNAERKAQLKTKG